MKGLIFGNNLLPRHRLDFVSTLFALPLSAEVLLIFVTFIDLVSTSKKRKNFVSRDGKMFYRELKNLELYNY